MRRYKSTRKQDLIDRFFNVLTHHFTKIGGVAIAVVFVWLPDLPSVERHQHILQAWLRLDWIGTLVSFFMVTMLLIALQWGGNEKPWNAPIVIAFLVLVSRRTLFFLMNYTHFLSLLSHSRSSLYGSII